MSEELLLELKKILEQEYKLRNLDLTDLRIIASILTTLYQ